MLPEAHLGEQTRVVIWLYRAGFAAIAPVGLAIVLPPQLRASVVPLLIALASMGAACLGWALRELMGSSLPRTWGIFAVVGSGISVAAASFISSLLFAQVSSVVFALIGLTLLVDRARGGWGSKSVSIAELALLCVLLAYTGIFSVAFANLLLHPDQPAREHGLYLPGLLLPVGAGMIALMPLTVAALAFASINERLVRKLADQALTDELTGTWSRRGLSELGPLLVAEHLRRQDAVAVLMVDIDHFKRINDQHGHAVGDRALRHVSSVLKAHLRADALLARYGGEEFTVLAPLDRPEELFSVAERLRAAVASSGCPLDEAVLTITVSIGVTTIGPEGRLEAAMKEADVRLYQAKQAGRNRVVAS